MRSQGIGTADGKPQRVTDVTATLVADHTFDVRRATVRIGRPARTTADRHGLHAERAAQAPTLSFRTLWGPVRTYAGRCGGGTSRMPPTLLCSTSPYR